MSGIISTSRPSGAGGGGIALLAENGDFLLTENGDFLTQES